MCPMAWAQDNGQLRVVAGEQAARDEDHAPCDGDGLVEVKPAPVSGKGRGGCGISGGLAAIENEEAILELRAQRGERAADAVQARFWDGGDVGLELRGESFSHLRIAIHRIVIVVLAGGRLRKCDSGGEEEKELHR